MMPRPYAVPLLAALLALPLAAQELTLEQVLERHYAAIGGLDAWKNVQSLRLQGTMGTGPGKESPFTMTLKRPDKMRIDFKVEGEDGVQAFDGTTAWVDAPFMGTAGPTAMPEEQTRMMRQQADFDGPLVDYGAKGHQIELQGKESLEDAEVYKLRITLSGGDVRHFYLGAEDFLIRLQSGIVSMQGNEQVVETELSDYREVRGLKVPHRIETRIKGMPQSQYIAVESASLDVDAPDSLFAMPAG